MKSLVETCLLALVILLAVYLGWSSTRPFPKSVAGTIETGSKLGNATKEKNHRFPVSRPPTTETAMRELASAFSGNPSDEFPATHAAVGEGESIYTQGYEAEPGYFAFSRVTPVMQRNPNGEAVVRLDFECIEMSVSGGSKTLVTKSVNIMLGRDLTFFLVTDEGIHNLVVEIGKDSQPSEILMKVHNSYQPNRR